MRAEGEHMALVTPSHKVVNGPSQMARGFRRLVTNPGSSHDVKSLLDSDAMDEEYSVDKRCHSMFIPSQHIIDSYSPDGQGKVLFKYSTFARADEIWSAPHE
jgi:hypothetical protein